MVSASAPLTISSFECFGVSASMQLYWIFLYVCLVVSLSLFSDLSIDLLSLYLLQTNHIKMGILSQSSPSIFVKSLSLAHGVDQNCQLGPHQLNL